MLIALACAPVPLLAVAPDGQLVQFNDNGIWCWFEDNRAVIDPNTNQLLISTIASGDGAGGAARDSRVEVVSYNLTTNALTSPYTLINFKNTLGIIADDHNTPSLTVRPDGRYVATYTAHQNDNVIRTRVSTNPGDATSWGPENRLSVQTNQGTTYSNTYRLSSNGVTYNFFRGNNYDPHVVTSTDDGATYTYAGHLLMDPGNSGGARPYVRYASNGVDKIYFLTSTGHPRDSNTGVYAGYMGANGRVYNLAGTDLGPLGTLTGSAVSASAFTPVMPANTVVNGTTRTHGWTTDIELDAQSRPFMGFTSRVNSSTADHRFYYSRWNGTALVTNEVARAGNFLYAAEPDYTGLMALNPSDANTLYISTKIDPRDGSGATTTNKYEIYRGFTTDTGATWQWVPITTGSTDDNIRPVVPTWDSTHTSLLWMKGTYTTYQHADMALVGKFYTGNNGKWTNAAGGTWGTAGNWGDGLVGDGMSFVADFSTLDISGTQTVSLGGGTRNLGFLNFADTNKTTASTWVIANGSLNLDGGVVAPIVNVRVNSSAAISATVAGAQGVTKTGDGLLTFSGNNTYIGNTVVSGGSLAVSGGSAIPDASIVHIADGAYFLASDSETIAALGGQGDVILNSGVTLTVGSNNASASHAGDIIGAGGRLTKIGTGIQALGSANTFTGVTTVNAGTLALNISGSLAGTAVTVNGGTLAATGSNTIGTSGSPTVTLAANAGNLSLVGGTSNVLSINSATAGATVLTLNGGNVLSFDSNAVGGDSIFLGTGLKAIATGANTININLIARPTANQTLTLISAPGGLTGGNTFTLGSFTGVSPFGSTFTLQATSTQLQLVETTTAAPTVAYFVGNRGTAWSANNGTLGNFSTDAAGTVFATALPDVTTDVHLYATGATLASVAASTLDSPFAVKTLAIDGGSAPVGINATGTGSLTIKPASSTVGLTVNAGSGAVTIAAPVVLGAAQTWTNNAASPLTVAGSTITNAGFRLTLTGTGNTTIGSAITGIGGLTKSGNGTAVLAATNTNTGTTTINAGTLQIGNGGTAGSLSTAAVTNFGTLVFNRSDAIAQGTHFGTIGGSGTIVQNGTGTTVLSAANNYTGVTNVNAGTLSVTGGAALGDVNVVIVNTAGTFNVAASETVGSVAGAGTITLAGGVTLTHGGNNASTTFSGNITGGGLLTKTGTGTLTLSGTNTYTGATSVSNGAISVASIAANTGTNNTINLGSGAGVGTLIYTGTGEVSPKSIFQSAGAAANGGTIVMAGTGTLRFTGATLAASQFQLHTLTLDGSTAGIGQIDSVISDGTATNKTSLLKRGTGTWVLAGANTYTGTTRIIDGTLRTTAAAYDRLLTNAGGVDLGDAGGVFVMEYAANSSPAATVEAILAAGVSDFTTGRLRSSDLSAGHTIGYADDGVNRVIVRVTLGGDADLDGDVDFNDFLVLQSNFGTAATGFDHGNFNYDGVVDFNDFLALQSKFGQTMTTDVAVAFTAEQVAAVTAFGAIAAVPEPAALTLAGVCASVLLRRRRA